MSWKWLILCRLGHKTLPHSISQFETGLL